MPKSHRFETLDEFQDGSHADRRMIINPSSQTARAGVQPLDLRMVRIDVNAGDPWILLTSLPRSEITRFVMGQPDLPSAMGDRGAL